MKEIQREERHHRKARYFVMPDEVLDLLEAKDITAIEAMLLGLINSYCSKNKDCYISNAFAAKILNVKSRAIIRHLNHLAQLGLIRRRFFKNRRYLVTYFSRPKLFREGVQKMTPPPTKNDTPPPTKNDTHIVTVDRNNRRERDFGGSPGKNGNSLGGIEKTIAKNRSTPPFEYVKLAKLLKNTITSAHRIKIKIPARLWGIDLSLIHSEDEVEFSRIKKAVIEFCRELRNGRDMLPLVRDAIQFRWKFIQIESRLKQIAGENEEDSVSGESPGGRTGKITIVDLGDISIAEARRQSWKD